jgi:hypothetical protein
MLLWSATVSTSVHGCERFAEIREVGAPTSSGAYSCAQAPHCSSQVHNCRTWRGACLAQSPASTVNAVFRLTRGPGARQSGCQISSPLQNVLQCVQIQGISTYLSTNVISARKSCHRHRSMHRALRLLRRAPLLLPQAQARRRPAGRASSAAAAQQGRPILLQAPRRSRRRCCGWRGRELHRGASYAGAAAPRADGDAQRGHRGARSVLHVADGQQLGHVDGGRQLGGAAAWRLCLTAAGATPQLCLHCVPCNVRTRARALGPCTCADAASCRASPRLDGPSSGQTQAPAAALSQSSHPCTQLVGCC